MDQTSFIKEYAFLILGKNFEAFVPAATTKKGANHRDQNDKQYRNQKGVFFDK